jgi:hypothetical protein
MCRCPDVGLGDVRVLDSFCCDHNEDTLPCEWPLAETGTSRARIRATVTEGRKDGTALDLASEAANTTNPRSRSV